MNRMQRGREAAAVSGFVKPYIDKQIEGLLQKQVALIRGQDPAASYFIPILAAQIASLYDLLSTLATAARQGEQAAKEELNGWSED